MLLLLKSPPSGIAAATCTLSLGLAALAGPQATLTLVAGLNAPNSVELNVFVTPDLTLGLTAIPVGFLTRTATADLQLPLSAQGGFGASATPSLNLGLSGTVGSFLQGTATETLVLGLTGAGSSPGSATLSAQLGLTGAPTVSGGTLTPTTSLPLTLSLSGAPVMIAGSLLDLTLGLTGTGITPIPVSSQARTMRLTFETDEIRVFFRKG